MEMNSFVKAGLLQREVAELLGVCRVTVNRWFKERTEPHSLIADKVEHTIAQIDEALEVGELPLPLSLPRDQRLPRLRRIIIDRELDE